MAAADRKTSFRWGRGIVAALLTIALGLAAVELLSPERHVGRGTVASEVTVRVVPRLAPSAEAIRRRISTNENLREVAARLKGGASTEADATNADDLATFESWRRRLVVEIYPTDDGQRRRIRFVAAAAGKPDEAAALVETVAVQYAESLAAERWYGAIDRLRSAEAAADATFDQLHDLLRNNQTASVRSFSSQLVASHIAAVPSIPRNLPTIAAAPIAATQSELERELFRLVQQRAALLETLQPAHPQVVAIDARLNSLQMVGAGTHVRRMAGEEPLDLTLPDFEEAPKPSLPIIPPTTDRLTSEKLPTPSPASEGLPATTADALRKWQASRAAVKTCLDELLAPAAAEFPVVSTAVSGLQLWEHRAFWRFSVAAIGLLVGIAFAMPRRGSANIEPVHEPVTTRPIAPHFEPVAAPTPAPIITEAVPPVPQAVVPPPTVSDISPPPSHEPRIETLEQAAAVTGGPVLGVLVRRREPASTVA